MSSNGGEEDTWCHVVSVTCNNMQVVVIAAGKAAVVIIITTSTIMHPPVVLDAVEVEECGERSDKDCPSNNPSSVCTYGVEYTYKTVRWWSGRSSSCSSSCSRGRSSRSKKGGPR
jgi:hypothetical protein